MDKPQTISILFEKYTANQCSPQEVDELMDWLSDSANETNAKEILLAKFAEPSLIKSDPILQERLGKRLENIIGQETPVRRIPVWKKIAVAASILLVISVAGYFILFNKKDKQEQIVNVPQDVKAPETNKALITLADGRKVLLDSITDGTLAKQGNIKVTKTTDGKIIYSSTEEASATIIEYNTMYNPRGSVAVPLTLIDGTIVWLNAESSLRYFTSVGKSERQVEITGECYFEVAKDATRPFIVKDVNRGTTVQVLGTHFNVNTYSDEPVMKVTLIEGSVKTSMLNGESTILEPGDQAQVSSHINVIRNADIEQVLAWKNGLFKMNNADIATIMRQLTRWYDVDVRYEGAIPKGTISGKVPRDLSLSEVLKVYELSGVKFKVERRTIVVTN